MQPEDEAPALVRLQSNERGKVTTLVVPKGVEMGSEEGWDAENREKGQHGDVGAQALRGSMAARRRWKANSLASSSDKRCSKGS